MPRLSSYFFRRPFLFLTLLPLLPAGCIVPPPLVDPPLPDKAMPGPGWTAPMAGKSTASPTAWLDQFDDARMRAAVREAVESNFDLQAAAARMRQAKARMLRQGADRFPDIAASLRTRQDWQREGTPLRWNRTDDFSLAFDVSWEADVWGRVRNTTSAAAAEAQAAAADYAAARLSLAANTAKAWCNVLEAERQVALEEQTLQSYRKGLDSVDAKQRAGVPDVSALDVRLARSSLYSSEAALKSRQLERDTARRTLESLMGRYPSGAIRTGARLPSLRRNIPVGLPSTLLLRRPDIAAEERRVAAALQTEHAARKALLPSIQLTSALRNATTDLVNLVDGRFLLASLGQSLTQPIFQGGRLRADIALTKAQREELAQSYASAAQQAFREVETALAAEVYLDGQINALRLYMEESVEAERLALSEYDKGLTDLLRVLESQRRASDSRSGLLRAENARLQNRIDLCLSLGGGF